MSKHLGKKQRGNKVEATPQRNAGRGKKTSNTRLYILVGLLVAAMVGWILVPILLKIPSNATNNTNVTDVNTPAANSGPTTSAAHNITFEKEGTLSFIKADGGLVKTIDIEVSDEDSERSQGLMHRQRLSDGQGMLFIFEEEEPQAFWMKNTYISLDILYVNAEKKIVSIVKNARPLSSQSLASKSSAQYVVEVPGGFSDAYGLQMGDLIQFELDIEKQ